MDVLKLLAITPAGAYQFIDSTGTRPALADGVSGAACSEVPEHLATKVYSK
jgi:hypothetical protein